MKATLQAGTELRGFTIELRPWGQFERYCAIFPDGTKKWLARVTTILATLNKEALIPWAVGQAMDACRERILPGQTYTQEQLEEILEWAKGASDRTKTEAAGHGTRAHKLIEAYLHTGTWPDLENEHLAVQNSIALFQEWWAAQKFRVTDLEAYVADLEMGYGGTVDCLALDQDGHLVLLDWKTSKAIYPEMELQVVGYGGAMARMGLGMPERALIVRIGKEDAAFEVVEVWKDLDQARTLYQAWKALVAVADWLKTAKAKHDAAKRARAKAEKAAQASQEVAVA